MVRPPTGELARHRNADLGPPARYLLRGRSPM